MARAQGARSTVAGAFEVAYGTPPVSGYFQLPFASTGLGAEQPLLSPELLGMGRDPQAPSLDAITADGDIVVPIDAEAFGFWLKGAFGAPVTTGITDKVHTFITGAWSLPSMSLETAMPEIPRYAMYSGTAVNTLGWSLARSGLLTASVGLISQGEVIAATSSAGTPTGFALQRFVNVIGSIKRDTVALGNLVSASVNYSNNMDRIETIRADGKIDGVDPSIAELSGSLDMRFADLTIMNQALAGTPAALEISYAISPTVSLSLTAHACYFSRPRAQIDGPKGIQVTFDWQAAFDTTAGKMATIVLKNTVAGY